MPIYEYKCSLCNHQFEILQKINDAPRKKCPECNSNNLRKLVSAAAFKLKGTGWYETDFKTKKSKKDKDSMDKVKDDTKKSTEKATKANLKESSTKNEKNANKHIIKDIF